MEDITPKKKSPKFKDPVGRAAKISATRLARRSSISQAAKDAYTNKSPEAKAASLSNLRLGGTTEVQLQAAARRSSRQKDINAKIAAGVKADWSSMTEEQRLERSRAALGIPIREYTMVDGSIRRFRSSWEAKCADVLIGLNVLYEYEKGFVLEALVYFPDFYLPEIDTIIEVKGHPKAYLRWNNEQLPVLKHTSSWHIPTYELGNNQLKNRRKLPSFNSLDEFLVFLTRVL
jgi:hypothetical protein